MPARALRTFPRPSRWTTPSAGAARRTINPPLGIGKIGGRLFGDPIQAIESDLTATALVLARRRTKVAHPRRRPVHGRDATTPTRMRADVAAALGVPVARMSS